MPANQFFTDWVTGDIITADKLNTMKNEVQPYLGYTPLNKAGDTWTGDLIGGNLYVDRYLGITGDINQAKWIMHTGHYSMIFYSDHNDSSYIPREADPTINRFGRTYRPKAALRPWGDLDITGEYRGRYDHQNRFVVQKYVDNITVPGNSTISIAKIVIAVPTGKAVYLRRVRWEFNNPSLRPRVGSTAMWTGNSAVGDTQMDQQLSNDPTTFLSLVIVNTSSNLVNQYDGHGIWAELEIR